MTTCLSEALSNLGKPWPQVTGISFIIPTTKPLCCHRPSCRNERVCPQPLTTTDVPLPDALLSMCVLLSLAPSYFHRLALCKKNKMREILQWRLYWSMTGFGVGQPCLNLAACETTLKTDVECSQIIAAGCIGMMDRISVTTWTSLTTPIKHVCKWKGWPLVLPGFLACLWNMQEGKKVTACRDARRTGKTLGNVSPMCERALPPRGCLSAWELDGVGQSSTTARVWTQKGSLSKGCTRCWLTLVC